MQRRPECCTTVNLGQPCFRLLLLLSISPLAVLEAMLQLAADPILFFLNKTTKQKTLAPNSLPAISSNHLCSNPKRNPLTNINGKQCGPIVDKHQLFGQIDRMVPSNIITRRAESLTGQPPALPSVLVACKAPPPTNPLVIIKNVEEPPKSPLSLFSKTPPLSYTLNSERVNAGELELETSPSPPVDSESFIFLKESLFDVYYHPLGSSNFFSSSPPATHIVSTVLAPSYVFPGPAALKGSSNRQTLLNAPNIPPIPFEPGSPPMFGGSPVHAPASTCPHAVFPSTIFIPDWSSPPLSMNTMKSSDSFGMPKDMVAELEELEDLAAQLKYMKWTRNVYDSSHEEDAMHQNSPAGSKELVNVFQKGSGHHRNTKVYVSLQSRLFEGI